MTTLLGVSLHLLPGPAHFGSHLGDGAASFGFFGPFDNGPMVCVFFVVAVFFGMSLLRRPHRRCPRCQQLNRPPARYCAHCGTRLNVP